MDAQPPACAAGAACAVREPHQGRQQRRPEAVVLQRVHDGHEVAVDRLLVGTDEDPLLLRVPGPDLLAQIAIRKTPFGKALENIGSIGVPIGSANTVMQGESPVLPGFGPWMTIPADKKYSGFTDYYQVRIKASCLDNLPTEGSMPASARRSV